MEKVTLIATSTFGLEAIVRRELEALGFKVLAVADGRIDFEATIADIPRANLWLRCADRVLVKMGEFLADDFDKLFDQTKTIPWDKLITPDGKIDVIGKSVKSKLLSVRTCQSMVKKAVIEKLQEKYKKEWLPESGAQFTISFSFLKDKALLTLDTSGQGLHKRGYRMDKGEVPLRENLAAALVLLSFWNKDRLLIDPMCGSGTILIEAAMIARNIAPGLNRKFDAENWPIVEKKFWEDARNCARENIKSEGKLQIFGYDIDKARISDSKSNAKKAGVQNDIIFQQKDIKDLIIEQEYGIIISNPPYGIKLSDAKSVQAIYRNINDIFADKKGWSLYILTADKKFPKYFKRGQPYKVRKLYNGTIETNYYQYYGIKPK